YNRDDSTIDITYSNVQGGWPGEGNIDADPRFVEPGYWDANGVWIDGDYHLLPDSPCIDTGDPNFMAEPNETDLDGKPRVLDGDNDSVLVVDMGAYEYRFAILAQVRIVPKTINLASKGKSITCYIWLPDEYDVADIEPNSVFFELRTKFNLSNSRPTSKSKSPCSGSAARTFSQFLR
ncbi:MAG: choice-of-anchor Q domain-containing protein, partial [Planctomycetota bacterium]